jgi:hypothetical protein
MRSKSVRGFKTGDLVRAEVPTGKQAAIHVGRVRASGSVTGGHGRRDQRQILCPSRGPLSR